MPKLTIYVNKEMKDAIRQIEHEQRKRLGIRIRVLIRRELDKIYPKMPTAPGGAPRR